MGKTLYFILLVNVIRHYKWTFAKLRRVRLSIVLACHAGGPRFNSSFLRMVAAAAVAPVAPACCFCGLVKLFHAWLLIPREQCSLGLS